MIEQKFNILIVEDARLNTLYYCVGLLFESIASSIVITFILM